MFSIPISVICLRLSFLNMIHWKADKKGRRRRRRFLDCNGFRFPTTFWNTFVIELRDSVVFSLVQTVMNFERIGWI
jgi:hypothetical protein